MARFEVTLSNGEKVVVNHNAPDMGDLMTELEGKQFLVLTEITGASTGASRDVLIAGSQITMIRPLGDLSTQGSNFRPKR